MDDRDLARIQKFNTSQKLVEQTRLILKEGWFSDFEILEICEQVNHGEYTQRELPPHKKKKKKKLKYKIFKTQHHNININIRRQGKCRWIDYISIPKESRLKKSRYRSKN